MIIELLEYEEPEAVIRADGKGRQHLRERNGLDPVILCGADRRSGVHAWEQTARDDTSMCKRCALAEHSVDRLKRVVGASGTALREKAGR